MLNIRYTIDDGVLPITVSLVGSGFLDNVHGSYGSYDFLGVPDGSYTLLFTDSQGCTYETPISICTECYEGYVPVGDKCILYDEQTPFYSSTDYTIVAESPNSSYGSYGTLLFDEGWNYNGTGTYDRWGTPYWRNNWTNLGPLNRTAVWANYHTFPQDIGFSFCINIAVEKTYYVGFACDNWGKIKLNGELILDQDVTALTNMIISNGDSYDGHPDRIPFRYWYIYPITLPIGQNVIEVFGHNETLNAAAVGIQIYDATPYDLENATSDEVLGDKILFDSIDLVGDPLHYEYNYKTDTYHGYYCNDGYALNTCGEEFLCVMRDELDCGETTTTTSSTTTTTTTFHCVDGYNYSAGFYICDNCNPIGTGFICNEYKLTIGKWYYDPFTEYILHITGITNCGCDYTHFHILDEVKKNDCNDLLCVTTTTSTSSSTTTTTTTVVICEVNLSILDVSEPVFPEGNYIVSEENYYISEEDNINNFLIEE